MLIFLSYARTAKEEDSDRKDRESDDNLFAEALRDLLTAAGFTVWRDVDDLSQGDWESAVFNATTRCDAMVVVVSDDSVASPQVEKEWQTALRLNKAVIPVRWRQCEENIPEELRRLQFCDFDGDHNAEPLTLDPHHLAKLIKYLNDVGEAGVYINYREGARDEALVARLRADLRAVGIKVWSDQDDATEQKTWGEAAQRGLNQARLMLLVASRSSMYSRRVDTQIRYFAIQMGKPVVLLLLDREARMGSELIGKPCIDFTFEMDEQERYQDALDRLLAELKRQGMHPQLRETRSADRINELSLEPPTTLTWDAFGRQHDGPLALFKPPVLQSYTRYTKAEFLIDRVKEELWVSGISLIRLSELTSHFKRLAEPDGKGVRFLLLNPECEAVVLDAGRYVGRLSANPEEGSAELRRLRTRMDFALDNLTELRDACPEPERIAIRVAELRPAMGYFIADPNSSDGFMTAYPYLYEVDRRPVEQRGPFLHLPRHSEERWFEVFKADFEAQWKDARDWPLEGLAEVRPDNV